MHVVLIEVTNYGPFKGRHRIKLEPSVYGIVGRHAADPGRSNWLGKSWALGAVRYALYGAHNAPSDDAMIHNGEAESAVHLEMDDGTLVTRGRKVGKATQLKYTPGKRPAAAATQKRAQELINDYMKMDLVDFDASCFIEQKQIARMVTASPADRTKIVNAWFELGPLQEAATHASDHLRTLLAEKSRNAQVRETSLAAFEDFDVEVARKSVAKLETRAAGLVELRRILKEQIQTGREWQREKRRADEFEELLVEGKEMASKVAMLEAALAAMDSEASLEGAAQEAATALTNAKGLLADDAQLARGEFDGQCPVMRSECFLPDQVAETKDDAKRRLPQLTETCDRMKLEYDEAMRLKGARVSLERDLEAAKRDVDEIRSDAQERADAADFIDENPKPIAVEALVLKEEQYDADIAALKADQALLEAQIKGYEAAMVAVEQYGPEAQKLDDNIRTAREAVAILGRSGAQKEIASSALAAIEKLANGLLSSASIDLTLAVRWAREGKGLASHCDACGAPFGASARVKACPGCNAARGPKLIEKLELELSNRSGAADDMAGLAFQLAASSWLRQKRGSDWSVVFIDEPFGALDETNARNLSSHLHTLIRGDFGFEQGFLVAHSASIMGAMPARVVVTSDGMASSLGVE